MFVDTFIRRPILASVCSLVIILAGVIAIPTLPIAQYPDLAPPQVQITAFYTGASAQVVESAVTTPIEQAINGVPGMLYMSSSSGNDGTCSITVTFDISREIDIAAVDVQNRISQVEGRLPNEVKAVGISVTKAASNFVMGASMYSENGQYDELFMSNYVDRFVKDELKRVPGVGDVFAFGERKYAMRLWVDPEKLAGRGLTAAEVVQALREQNVQVAAGQVGQTPARSGQQFQISVRAVGRLTEPSEFDNIILKRTDDGTLVRLKDVGRTELGAENYSTNLRYNRRDAVGFGVSQLPQANSLQVYRDVVAALDRLSKKFPPGLKVEPAFDTTTVVADSIREVVTTLLEAIGLVVLVMFLFLQNWRTTLIPAITIPVSLIGTFAFVKLFGFSINTLTLFGITLATGLVVDDAIVVIENIERHIHDHHKPAAAAASDAMAEVTSAVIATALVLAAVFVPVAFFPGTTGRLYQQFALTIAVSMAISAFNALTLTPALSALLLSRVEKPKGMFFRGVNRVIDGGTSGLVSMLRRLIRFRAFVVIVFVALLGATYWLYLKVPAGFVPDEDQGYLMVIVQAPQGASLEYTTDVLKQIDDMLVKVPEVKGVFAITGFGFAGSAPNQGIVFASLKEFKARKGDEHSAAAIQGRLFGAFSQITGANVFPILPPSINGLGQFGGFTYELLDQTGGPIEGLATAAQQLIGEGYRTPGLAGLFTQFTANDPQFTVTIDREQAKSLGMSLGGITDTMQILLGSAYVNDFDFNNRSYRVYVQADQNFRMKPDDIKRYYTRTGAGRMMPLSDVVSIKETTTAKTITHFNLFRSAEINGSAAPSYSSGQALQIMSQLSDRALPQGFSYAWSGLSLEETKAGNQSAVIFGLGLLLVYLTLAAQYESITLPFIILLSVPLAVMGALLAQWGRGLINDVYCQIGLVMLIGLSAKNGILIVEFAEQLRARGLSIAEAAVEAARIRLRPILMTSLAFILGVMPLVVASGAGRAARHSVGTAVVGGMLASTFLNLAFIPVLYVVVKNFGRKKELAAATILLLAFGAAASAQTPAPVERLSFNEAITRAIEKNPSTAIAAAGILRAEALLTEAQSATRLQVNGTVTTTTLNRGVEFQGSTVSPRNQVSGGLDVRLPLFAPGRWARRVQAQDRKDIADLAAADTRRQTALATADAYLTIIARRRVVEANDRARDTARAHFDLARELEQRGTGSRLNQLRAQQELSIDDSLVESARLALYRAQEALGVLLVADGPVDATDEPAFDIPSEAGPASASQGLVASGVPAAARGAGSRTDLRLLFAERQAAETVLRDSSKDSYPYLEGIFLPQTTYPSQFFVPANSWRFLLQMSVPLFDGRQRKGARLEREAALNVSKATLAAATTQATSDVRTGREAVMSVERGLASARAAADQAQQVVNIVNISFRAGAATNIEVIDAERRARDADTAVAVAEDVLRRARLELLTALGRFPQ